jgi:hypothetical protein
MNFVTPLYSKFLSLSGLTSSSSWRGFLFIPLGLAYLFVAPMARAVTPAPDGGYPNANTAEGDDALFSLTGNALNNTAVGYNALYTDTDGSYNTAVGTSALSSNASGNLNTAVGYSALDNNTGSYNTATGSYALTFNLSGVDNTANGYQALLNNNGDYNTALGFQALYGNTTGSQNTASGLSALASNVDGSFNTANGVDALHNSTHGNSNTAMGVKALVNNTGSNNVALGSSAGASLTTGSSNIVIGAGVLGVAGEASITRIGKSTQKKTFITGIYNKTVPSGVGVIVNSSGQLGTVQSSARYKDKIKPMDKASEIILALKPVTFRYKEEFDPDAIPQFGLVAEEVEKVNPDLVVHDEDGQLMTVRYEAVNAMLLNEFLKEHRKVENQAATIAEMKKQIDTLAVGLQKMAAQMEAGNGTQKITSNPMTALQSE